MADTADLVAR